MQRLGVSMIHQELNLLNELTVAQNIFLSREPRGGGRRAGRGGLAVSRADDREGSRETFVVAHRAEEPPGLELRAREDLAR